MNGKFQNVLIGAAVTLFAGFLAVVFFLNQAQAESPVQEFDSQPSTESTESMAVPNEKLPNASPQLIETELPPLPSSSNVGDTLINDVESIGEKLTDILSYRDQLLDKWAETLSAPGWLHTTVLYEFDSDNHGTLEDGTLIPGDYIIESWEYVNEAGIIIERVDVMKNLDGDVVQTGNYRDGFWRNFSDQSMIAGPPPQHPIVYIQNVNMQPTATEVIDEVDASGVATKVILFTLQQANAPIKLDDINAVSVGSMRYEAYDVDTGRPLRVAEYILFEDGSQQLMGSYEYLTMEVVDELPSAMHDILEMDITTSGEAKDE